MALRNFELRISNRDGCFAIRNSQSLMFFLLAYDIAEPKRLRRVAKLTEMYGTRVQRSVFECTLSQAEMVSLLHEVKALIERKEDKVQVYQLCEACKSRFKRHGQDGELTADDEVYVF